MFSNRLNIENFLTRKRSGNHQAKRKKKGKNPQAQARGRHATVSSALFAFSLVLVIIIIQSFKYSIKNTLILLCDYDIKTTE
jgi:hypothetical protein